MVSQLSKGAPPKEWNEMKSWEYYADNGASVFPQSSQGTPFSAASIAVTGDGFLYNMVRIIAGTLVFCGIHKINPDEIPGIIESKDRSRAGITAPAKGLFLTEVFY